MTGYARFNSSWADDGVLGDPSTPQSDAGFAFLGQAPPTVELFNSMFRWNDEKDNYLYNQMASVFTWGGQTAAEGNPNTLRDAIIGKQKLRLVANLSLYVATTGDNADSGAIGEPFLTLQKAWDYVAGTIDLNGYTVTVHVADGTYTAGVHATGAPVGVTSPNSVLFTGNTTTPANVIISATNGICFSGEWGGQFAIRGFRLVATGTGDGQGIGVYTIGAGSYINYGLVEFGACAVSHVYATAGTQVVVADDYTISGNSPSHFNAFVNSSIIINNGIETTLTGTPAFSNAFAIAAACSCIAVGGSQTYTGSATGARYSCSLNGVIMMNGNATFPGNSVGATASGGQVAA